MKLPKPLWIALALSAVFLFGCGVQHRTALRDHGKETTATVLLKGVSADIRATNNHHYINIGFFSEEVTNPETSIEVLSDTNLSMSERLDKWQPGKMAKGTYQSIQIYVLPENARNLIAGDKVKIIYLPEDPSVAMLKDELSD